MIGELAQRRKAMAEGVMRDAICAAATTVLAQVGYAALTMERVAEVAGVAKGTLYNYFQDKETLALEVIDRAFLEVAGAIDRAVARAGAPLLKLSAVVRLALAGVDERRALGQALCASALPPRLAAELRTRKLALRRVLAQVFAQAQGQLGTGGPSPAERGRFLGIVLSGVMDERIRHAEACPEVATDASLVEELVLRLWFKEMQE